MRGLVGASGSGEGKVFEDVFDVARGDKDGFAELALPFATLLLQNVTLSLLPAQNLPGTCHLETFGDGLSGLCLA